MEGYQCYSCSRNQGQKELDDAMKETATGQRRESGYFDGRKHQITEEKVGEVAHRDGYGHAVQETGIER